MMAPHVYEQARANAPIHLQMLRTGRVDWQPGSDSARVTGRIVRIFRDRDHQVHLAQRITVAVSVSARSRSGPPILNGTVSYDIERLRRARWFELFLQEWNGDLLLVRSQLSMIRHPTVRPVVGPDVKGAFAPSQRE